MAVWLFALMTVVVIFLAAWFYTRRLAWQFAHIAKQLNRITSNRQADAAGDKKILRQIYKLVNTCLLTGKAAEAYRAFDLLKLALGHGLGRPGEAVQLTTVFYLALRSNQLDAAGHCIDAFRPLLKNMTGQAMPAAIEQLGLIAVISLKQRHNFLAARAVDVISTGMAITREDALQTAGMRALRLTGLTALRRNDSGLIREMLAKIAGLLAMEPGDALQQAQAAEVVTAWLHRIVKAGNDSMYEVLTEYISQLAGEQLLSAAAVEVILKECVHLAGMESLNPYSRLAGAISLFGLELALQMKTPAIWRQAVDGSGHAARLAVAQRNLTESFGVIYPLFEAGRRLLSAELNAGHYNDTFRQEALYTLIRECLHLVEFVTRQNFTTTAADVIDEIYRHWLKQQNNIGQEKSIKRFCQLLFIYGARIKRRQKRFIAGDSSFNTGNAITPANQEHLKKLGFLL